MTTYRDLVTARQFAATRAIMAALVVKAGPYLRESFYALGRRY